MNPTPHPVAEIPLATPDLRNEVAQLRQRLDKAAELLRRCDDGFGGFVMGRRMARAERDKLRDDIQRWLFGRR